MKHVVTCTLPTRFGSHQLKFIGVSLGIHLVHRTWYFSHISSFSIKFYVGGWVPFPSFSSVNTQLKVKSLKSTGTESGQKPCNYRISKPNATALLISYLTYRFHLWTACSQSVLLDIKDGKLEEKWQHFRSKNIWLYANKSELLHGNEFWSVRNSPSKALNSIEFYRWLSGKKIKWLFIAHRE